MPHETIDGITSSIIPFYQHQGTAFVVLGQRGPNSEAFANAWCLVGGFHNPGKESLQQCAARELHEETGLDVPADAMKLVINQSNPKRDPRGVIIDTVWSCKLESERSIQASDDIQDARWFPLAEAIKMQLAFDHNDSLARFAAAEGLA